MLNLVSFALAYKFRFSNIKYWADSKQEKEMFSKNFIIKTLVNWTYTNDHSILSYKRWLTVEEERDVSTASCKLISAIQICAPLKVTAQEWH